MANFGKLTFTSEGLRLQALAEGGTSLVASRIAMGSAKFTGDITSLTSLIKEEVSLKVNESRLYDDNKSYIIGGYFENKDLQNGFEWRELGLFMEDPSDPQKEILYCYSNAGDTGDYIPSSEDERYEKYLNIQITFDNASSVTINASNPKSVVSNTEFEEYKNTQQILLSTLDDNLKNKVVLIDSDTQEVTPINLGFVIDDKLSVSDFSGNVKVSPSMGLKIED